LEGNRGEDLEGNKKKGTSGRSRRHGEGIVLGGSIFFNLRNSKFVLEEGLGGLYTFFKFNLCCYNIFKLKNILIININLSLSKYLLI